VLELGAGTGVMAVDILAELQRRNALPDKYLILETSADLRQRQQQLLQQRYPDIFARIGWLDTLPLEPVNGVILANEVLDALPVRRIKIENNRFFEQMVTSNKHSFAWLSEPANAALAAEIDNHLADCLADLPNGYITEYNTLLPTFIQSASDVLGNGAMLFLDYGYPRREFYHPQRNDGTLLCHYRHRSHSDPFINIGIQDITAAVDFTLVAEAATIAGLEIAGYTTQAGFLIACGIDEIINEYGQGDDMASLRYSQQARQLLLPGQMGESFKVIALSRNIETPLQGFEFSNQVQRL
jgi:SAM-dependent MidA family methyltransferase